MKKKISDTLGKTAPQLAFALAAGCAYFLILLPLIMRYSNGSPFLAFNFSPAIIAGAALVIIKLVRRTRENENDTAVCVIFVSHIILLIMGAVFTIAAFM